MDTLVALSTGIAYLFSLFNLVFRVLALAGVEPHVYFEAAAVIVAFILLGRTLEEKAKGDTTASLKKLIGLQPKKCDRRRCGRYADGDTDQPHPGRRPSGRSARGEDRRGRCGLRRRFLCR